MSVRILVPPQKVEPVPLAGENPEEYALRAALAKASSVFDLPEYAAVLEQAPPAMPPLVVAADTIVTLCDRILGKPRDSGHALDMLRKLSGKKHTVITGCALLSVGMRRVFAVRSRVDMWRCPDELLRAYAESGEPMDKAGAYAVQGLGAFLVRSVSGSWSNVVGLPLAELVRSLMEMRAIAPDARPSTRDRE